MAEGMCAKCSRYLLIAFNFLFWVSGGALLGVGIWIRVDTEVESALRKFVQVNLPLEVLYTGAYVLIAVGAFIFTTGFCGCCGAIRESACMLAIYIGCLTVVLLGEIAGGVYIAIERGKLENMLLDNLSTQVNNYTTPGSSSMDFVQVQFKCCGAENYTDYEQSLHFLNHTEQNTSTEWHVPDSCCKAAKTSSSIISISERNICQSEARDRASSSSTDQLQTTGCYGTIKDWVYTNSAKLIGVVAGIALLEILGIIFAACLYRNRSEYWEWEE